MSDASGETGTAHLTAAAAYDEWARRIIDAKAARQRDVVRIVATIPVPASWDALDVAAALGSLPGAGPLIPPDEPEPSLGHPLADDLKDGYIEVDPIHRMHLHCRRCEACVATYRPEPSPLDLANDLLEHFIGECPGHPTPSG